MRTSLAQLGSCRLSVQCSSRSNSKLTGLNLLPQISYPPLSPSSHLCSCCPLPPHRTPAFLHPHGHLSVHQSLRTWPASGLLHMLPPPCCVGLLCPVFHVAGTFSWYLCPPYLRGLASAPYYINTLFLDILHVLVLFPSRLSLSINSFNK